MYVNDVLVAETNDDTFKNGNTGLTVAAFGKDISIEFDDVRVWSASVTGGETAAVSTSHTSADLPESLTSYDELKKSSPTGHEGHSIGLAKSSTKTKPTSRVKGIGFTPLASRSPHKNIAMAAELTFTVGNTDKFSFLHVVELNQVGQSRCRNHLHRSWSWQ